MTVKIVPGAQGIFSAWKMYQQTESIKRLQYQVKNEIYLTIATPGVKYIFDHSHQFT